MGNFSRDRKTVRKKQMEALEIKKNTETEIKDAS